MANEKCYTGFCGEHCPQWSAFIKAYDGNVARGTCGFNSDIVRDGDICSVPPCGPWQQMEDAPKDGEWVRLLFYEADPIAKGYDQADGVWEEGWCMGGDDNYQVDPIAFAIINRPWEAESNE